MYGLPSGYFIIQFFFFAYRSIAWKMQRVFLNDIYMPIIIHPLYRTHFNSILYHTVKVIF